MPDLLETPAPAMNTLASAAALDADAPVDTFPYPPDNLLSDDGEPLESNWHVLAFQFLIAIIQYHRRDQKNFFAGGNMFVYYSRQQARDRDYRGPDFFLVNDVEPRPDRPYWAIWDEGGRYPDLVVELMSPTTRKNDLTTKFDIYEKIFSTREYVAYDPKTHEILAWRKGENGFQPIAPDRHGHYPLLTAGLSIGNWVGKRYQYEANWLRFFDDEGRLILEEGEAELAHANAEKARADALADELARLQAQHPSPA